MALRRRDQIPPYEIMRSRGGGAAGDVAPGVSGGGTSDVDVVEDSPSPDSPSAANRGGGGSAAPWWVGSSSPIVLRVPRGLAAVIVLGLFLLIVLAYWVGSARGSAATRAELTERGAVAGAPGPREAPPISVSQESPPSAAGNSEPVQRVEQERRRPGLNYLQLQTGGRDEGQRLAEFMADKGVQIQLVETAGGEWVVFAVDRGYRADELNSESCVAYKRKLMDLGRAWKRHNGSRGSDLNTMLFTRFDG